MAATAQIDWFSLTDSILSTIFSQWLSIRDISSLDIATSEKEKRTRLLAMFMSAEFVLEGRRAFFRTYPKIETFDDLGCYEERE